MQLDLGDGLFKRFAEIRCLGKRVNLSERRGGSAQREDKKSGLHSFALFVANGFDRIEPGRLHGGIDAEKQSDSHRNAKGYGDGGAGDDG